MANKEEDTVPEVKEPSGEEKDTIDPIKKVNGLIPRNLFVTKQSSFDNQPLSLSLLLSPLRLLCSPFSSFSSSLF